MSLCNFRTFTIILVLKLVAFETLVESFTIQRTLEVPGEPDQITQDSEPAESAKLEVRNDLRRNVKPIELKTDSPPLTVPIQTTAKTEEIQKNEVKSSNTKDLPDANTTSTSASVMTTENKKPKITSSETPNPSDTTPPSHSVSSSTTPNLTTQVPQKSASTSISTSEDELDKYLSKLSKEESTLPAFWSASENVREITSTTDNITATMKNEDLNKNISEVNVEKQNTTKLVNVTDAINITNTTEEVNITQKVNTTLVKSANLINGTNKLNTSAILNGTNEKKLQNKSSDDKDNVIKNMTTWLNLVSNNTMTKELKPKTGENNTTGYSTEAVKVNETAVDKMMNNSNDGIQNMTDTNSTILTTTVSSRSESTEKQSNQTEGTEEKVSSTETLTGDYNGVTGVPYWKRYTTIERKRVNTIKDSETSTEKDQDLLQSGTAQTQTTISLEKALNIISDIPSLEQLKNDLLALNKMSPTTENTESTESIKTGGTSKSTEAVRFSESPSTTQGFSVVTSKRAGYLDFSSRPVNGTKTTKIKEAANVTEVPWNYISHSRPPTTPRSIPEPKSMTSQSQLAEDAINEELMKEEVLFENVENAKRVQEERFGARTKPTVNIPPNPTTGPKADSSSSEDKLRVRPISAEKLKNGSLYSPNPNYKPLKKIEVQPPKPFVRNPDDNSWRNESLSSRGIVFKANNSSKPFTQVLKNKTETEFNALLDRYNKGDAPELRTRLEKIAEMRKTKKKKVNALGETVYTDYEESSASAENSNSSNTGSFEYNRNKNNISSFLDQVELNKPTTTTARGYDFDNVELTTKKAQKLLDEYDDDDEEEYTLPNIDLKKYLTSTSAPAMLPSMSVGPLTSPPLPLPVRTFPPDRRPTVQYFPPRDKPQKVVLNDYDTVFQQKVNKYTYNSPPKITNPAPKPPPPPPPSTEVTFNFPKNKFEQQNILNEIAKRPQQMDRNIYLTQPAQDPRNTNGIVNPPQDVAGYNQAPYVIKHLRDFIDEVVRDDAPTATEESVRGVTVNNVVQEDPKVPKDYYDYEAQFRKDVISRFVENFNQNSERFKADFPILYNTSVVHSPGLPGSGGAESTAFMKRLYDDVRAFNHQKDVPKRYDINCDRTVELSPAYELHYYVPEEEEKQVVELKPNTLPPHRFRL